MLFYFMIIIIFIIVILWGVIFILVRYRLECFLLACDWILCLFCDCLGLLGLCLCLCSIVIMGCFICVCIRITLFGNQNISPSIYYNYPTNSYVYIKFSNSQQIILNYFSLNPQIGYLNYQGWLHQMVLSISYL